MTQENYLVRFKEVTDTMYAITSAKNSDYSSDDDAFLNFKLVEKLTNGTVSAEEGLIVRITDKLQRATNLLKRKNKVADEKLEDTLLDLANYAIILRIYLETKL